MVLVLNTLESGHRGYSSTRLVSDRHQSEEDRECAQHYRDPKGLGEKAFDLLDLLLGSQLLLNRVHRARAGGIGTLRLETLIHLATFARVFIGLIE